MKKILIIVTLLLLTGCEKMSILNTVYISSIGIDFVDNEYVGYFYSPPTKDIGKDDSSDEATVYVLKDVEFSNLFTRMFDSDPTNINMFHLKTMIISSNFSNFDVLLDYFRFSNKVSYNFHVFISNDDLKDVYEFKTMSNISNLYNFLNSPSLIDYNEHGISKCHFLSFANDYSNEYRYNIIPLVKVEYNSINEDEFQLKIDGYSNTNFIYETSIYKGIKFLYSSDKEISVDNNVCLLSDYNINFIEKDNVYNIDIEYKKVAITGFIDVEGYIVDQLNFYFDTVLFNEGDLYMISQYNYLYNKNLSNYYIINIKEK